MFLFSLILFLLFKSKKFKLPHWVQLVAPNAEIDPSRQFEHPVTEVTPGEEVKVPATHCTQPVPIPDPR
jgi:hypothetical protein